MPVPVLTQERAQLSPSNLRRSAQTTNRTHAINILTLQEQASFSTVHTPPALKTCAKILVHLVTGKTISSYKKLMHNPATAKVWQTAFGGDFRSMAQGDNKMGQKGTNAMDIYLYCPLWSPCPPKTSPFLFCSFLFFLFRLLNKF